VIFFVFLANALRVYLRQTDLNITEQLIIRINANCDINQSIRTHLRRHSAIYRSVVASHCPCLTHWQFDTRYTTFNDQKVKAKTNL